MCRMIICALLSLASLAPSAAHAKTASRQVMEGDRVRLSSWRYKGTYIVEELRSDTLTLSRVSPSGEPLVLPLSGISSLKVARARSKGEGAMRGGGIGFIIGSAGGALIGFASRDDPQDGWEPLSMTAGEKAFAGALLLGTSGLVVGSIIGLSSPGEKWVRVDPGPCAGLCRDRNGALALTCSLRL